MKSRWIKFSWEENMYFGYHLFQEDMFIYVEEFQGIEWNSIRKNIMFYTMKVWNPIKAYFPSVAQKTALAAYFVNIELCEQSAKLHF